MLSRDARATCLGACNGEEEEEKEEKDVVMMVVMMMMIRMVWRW